MSDARRGAVQVRRLLLAPLEALMALLLLFDELARPLYRPLIRWIVRQRFMAALEAAVSRLPPYGILALLAVPYALAEPLKIVGLWWLGTGRVALGTTALIVGHGASFLLIERIYHAGRAKLLTIPWFAVIAGAVARLRDAVLDRLRTTPLWKAAHRFARRVRLCVRQVRRRAS